MTEENKPNQPESPPDSSTIDPAPDSGSGSGSATQEAKPTEMLEVPENFDPKPMPDRIPTPNTARLSLGWRLIFRIGDQKVPLDIADMLVIGRGLEEGSDDVDLDLTPHGAYHFGVSRKHAIITLKDGYLYLEDLGSTNGTRINGFQLTAKQKYRLRDGDEIEFARLRTSIRFRNPELP